MTANKDNYREYANKLHEKLLVKHNLFQMINNSTQHTVKISDQQLKRIRAYAFLERIKSDPKAREAFALSREIRKYYQ